MKRFETVWCAPSNIALVKYWGKKEGQIPQNPSLSFSLQNSTTTTSISALLSDKFGIEFEFEGKPSRKFKTRILKALKRWAQDFPELKDYAYKIKSSNTFPHSAGIASSASSMASLALCITELESKLIGVEDFYKRASYFARLASGSASRSIFGEYNVWGEIPSIGTSNQYSSVVYAHETLKQIGDFVLIVSSKEKAVASSLGHQLMNYHPYASTRYEIARENIRVLLNALETGDWIGFGEIVENEALSLHALMMTSSPAVILLKPESLSIISRVQEFRVKNKIPLYFTIDAGPNIHLLYPLKYKKKVESFIQSDLLTFTEDGVYIDDQIGSGPYQP